MPVQEVYQRISRLLYQQKKVSASSIIRCCMDVTGLLGANNSSPAQVAKSVEQMQLREIKAERLEWQIRRMENDPEISAETCFHRLAREHLLLGKPQELELIIDPTLQEDRIVMVSLNVWYRGRTLPIYWTTWPANCPLVGVEKSDVQLGSIRSGIVDNARCGFRWITQFISFSSSDLKKNGETNCCHHHSFS